MEKLEYYSEPQRDKEKEKLIIENLPLVKSIAERLSHSLPPTLDKEDLFEAGVLGLIDAVNRYDPSKNCKFKTFASIRIRGAILDEVRSLAWMPKTLRQRARELENVIVKLEQELGRSPKDEEVAEKLGVSVDDYRKLLFEIRGISLVYMEELGNLVLDASSFRAFEMGDEPPVDSLYKKELADILSKAIDELSERERLVITLYYYEGLTIREIGKVLGLAKSTVSEIHVKTLLKLRGKLRKILGGEGMSDFGLGRIGSTGPLAKTDSLKEKKEVEESLSARLNGDVKRKVKNEPEEEKGQGKKKDKKGVYLDLKA